MKNILLIMPYGSVGGMERLAEHFYNFYKTQGHKVKVAKFFQLQTDIINFNEDEIALSTKDLHELSKTERLLFYLLTAKRLKKIIKANNITHSIAFGDMANIFSSLTRTSEFKIASIHALKSVELKNESVFNKVVKWSYKSTYKHFDKVVCISESIKKDLIANCGYKFENNLKVIYNPHDVKALQTLALEDIEDSSENVLFQDKTILFIGRLSSQKSPWHLINAFYLLQQDISNVNLVFIGDGDASIVSHIKTLIDTYGLTSKIHFLGRKKNPYKYLKKANVLALSSHFEGTPNVIVESIALGVPIVSSNCTDGIAELMSVIQPKNTITKNTNVEAGIITPNLLKNKLGIPESNAITAEERLFSKALADVLRDSNFKSILNKSKQLLLEKFTLGVSATNYLTENN